MKSESDDDYMKMIDEYEPHNPENIEKSLCNINIHLALIAEQLVELVKVQQESNLTLNKQVEILLDEVKGVRLETAEVTTRLRNDK